MRYAVNSDPFVKITKAPQQINGIVQTALSYEHVAA